MELSINAIITIVIAFMLLGLGFGLLNGVLSVGGSSLAQAVDGYHLDFPASYADQLVITNPLPLKYGEFNVVMVSFYNNGNSLCDDSDNRYGAWLYVQCPDLSFRTMQTVPLNVPSATSKTLGLSVELARGTVSGTYPCFAQVYCEEENIFVNEGMLGDSAVAVPVYSKAIFVKVS